MKQKSLKEISWLVPENEYRSHPALSYSILSKFYRGGFEKLSTLFESQTSPSLVFGSAVDCIMTEGREAFLNRFKVIDYTITDSGLNICKSLASLYGSIYTAFTDIPIDIVSDVAKQCGFWQDPKWDSRRYNEVVKTGDVDKCYEALSNSDKIVISSTTFSKVLDTVDALKTYDCTNKYFTPDLPFEDNIERLYQLKFKQTLKNGIEYRGMLDLVIVDHDKKTIQPIDLKTSSKQEYSFYKSFVEFNYDIQARLYYRLLKKTIEQDEYFKDFEILDYLFIVVNKDTLNPLVWIFDKTKTEGEIYLKGDWSLVFVDPEDIGAELTEYLNHDYQNPIGIYKDEPNNIMSNIIKHINKSHDNNI